MYFRRKIDKELLEWKKASNRKPLLIRGARQTGKTSAVRHLGKLFRYYLEVNFERERGIHRIFEGDLDVHAICRDLELRYGVPIVAGETLLFFDEIQSCPGAISALRYFYEDYSCLHVIATGSLLEFAFSALSDFGVGRIRNMYVYPFSFGEFAAAMGKGLLYSSVQEASFEKPLSEELHQQLLLLLRNFMIVGGMPAVVNQFVETGSFLSCQQEQDDIMQSLKSDFDKYHQRIPSVKIRDTLRSIIKQTGEKFVYTDNDLGLEGTLSKQCIPLLSMAKLIYEVSMSYGNGLPLGGETNRKMSKFIFLDTGLYLRESGLAFQEWLQDAPVEFVNRGKLGELFVGLELLKCGSSFAANELYHWHREARSSNAEVDYLVQCGNSILPIEVKSGTKGSMQSLQIFLEEKQLPFGVRTSQENFALYRNIRVIPLYAISEYQRYLCQNPRIF